MKFKELSSFLEKLEKTSSRIEITKILADLFKHSKEDEIDKITYLVLGGVAPSYRGVVFNVAEKMMIRVIAEAYSKDIGEVTSLYKKMGDLGSVAETLAKGEGKGLDVDSVYERLLKIANDEGEGSQERKVTEIAKLLKDVDGTSAKFVVRIPLGRLRLGFSDKTILDAISWMETGGKGAKKELESAYFVLPDAGLLAKSVKKLGVKRATAQVSPVVGVPVLPMLAQRLKSPGEMISKMGGEVGVEPKLDGLRLQIHYSKDGVKAFTRNLNENSWMFPELTKIGSQIKAKEVILDSEAVGLDESTKQMANFQATMTRRRKHEIEEKVKKIGIEFFVFDILFKDGKNLMHEPYTQRRKVLEETLTSGNVLKLVPSLITKNPEKINDLYSENIKKGYEGLVVKKATGDYFSGRTGWRWVKMKHGATSNAKLSDTIDAVVMGYTRGRGKRASFGVGQFLAGIKDGDKYKTITKVGTGLSDEQFKELNTRLKKIDTKEKPKEYDVDKDLVPDYWVTPQLVVELAADEITQSPKHTSDYALRFPRLIRFRDDKRADQVTSKKELMSLFKLQKG